MGLSWFTVANLPILLDNRRESDKTISEPQEVIMKRTFCRCLWVLLVLLWGFPFLKTTANTDQSGIFLKQDFRNSQFEDQNFRYMGQNAKEYVKPSAEGLRITIPSLPDRIEAGIATKFPIDGDFIVTVSYRIIEMERPEVEHSSNVQIYAPMNGAPGKPAVAFSRTNRKTDGNIYSTAYMYTDEEGKRHPNMASPFPTNIKAGKLRMQRKEDVFILSVAEEGAKKFRELHRWKVSNAPVSYLRFACISGGESRVDALIESVDLYSGNAIPSNTSVETSETSNGTPPQAQKTQETPETQSNIGLWLVAGFVVVGLGAAASLWLWTRAKSEEEEDDEDEET